MSTTHFPRIVGGHLGLDLVNTVAPRTPSGDEHEDYLATAQQLLDWSRRVGVLSDVEADAVSAAWATAGTGEQALRAVWEIREATYEVLKAALSPPVDRADRADHAHPADTLDALGRLFLALDHGDRPGLARSGWGPARGRGVAPRAARVGGRSGCGPDPVRRGARLARAGPARRSVRGAGADGRCAPVEGLPAGRGRLRLAVPRPQPQRLPSVVHDGGLRSACESTATDGATAPSAATGETS